MSGWSTGSIEEDSLPTRNHLSGKKRDCGLEATKLQACNSACRESCAEAIPWTCSVLRSHRSGKLSRCG